MNIPRYVLEVTNLRKCYYPQRSLFSFRPKEESFCAVDDISFTVTEGEIVGLLGPNGAGKTTTIQMLLGTLTPSAGVILYFNTDFSQYRSYILRYVTFASTYVNLPPKLTIEENLYIFARLYGIPSRERKQRITRVLELFRIDMLQKQLTGSLSAGQMTRVMLAKAFLPCPRIVLLDEPTASLDPDIAHDVRQHVLELRERNGVSFLFTSHNMDEVTQVCDRVLVLKNGKIIADNTPEELAASVTNARIHLLIGDGMKRAVAYLEEHKFAYQITERIIQIDVDEKKIAQLLIDMARAGITYTSISIDTPTLEDYFLHIARDGSKI